MDTQDLHGLWRDYKPCKANSHGRSDRWHGHLSLQQQRTLSQRKSPGIHHDPEPAIAVAVKLASSSAAVVAPATSPGHHHPTYPA